MPPRPLPKAMSNRRNSEVFERLTRIAPGLSAYLVDAWYLLEEDPPKKTVAHLVGHLAREIESGLRAVVLGLVGRRQKTTGTKKNHLADVNAILSDLGLSKHPDAESWRAFASEESLDKIAHRNDLSAPRSLQVVAGLWDRFVAMLGTVLDAVDAKFLEVARTVDELAVLDAPSAQQVKQLKASLPPQSI